MPPFRGLFFFSIPLPIIIMHTVLIVMAMEEEADPLLEILPFTAWPKSLEPHLPTHAYTVEVDGLQVVLAINGRDPFYQVASFGTDAATLTTYLGIRAFTPDLVMSVGVAGGFRSKGAEIGTVYISHDTVRYFDRRVSIKAPNYHDYAIGYYPVVDASQMAKALNLPMGIIVTGNSFENSPADDEQIHRHDASAIEMEAGAVARISQLMHVPFLAVKSVVNFEEDPTSSDQFEAHFEQAAKRLASTTVGVIQYLAVHGLPGLFNHGEHREGTESTEGV